MPERGFSHWRPHPWHGLTVGDGAPRVVTAYVEITPFDLIKYEIDKATGYLRVDRPQRTSSQPPALYGFIPQTYCAEHVAALSKGAERGDGDPLDICVLSEKSFSHGDILLQAVPVGGLRLLDREEADDKIIAVLKGDAAFGHCRELAELPGALIDRLVHYFLTYKRPPGEEGTPVMNAGIYGRADAWEVIQRSREDYQALFPDLQRRFLESLRVVGPPA